jgi:hypothetical protein
LQLLRRAYGDAVLFSAQVLRCHNVFKDGRESVEDEQGAVCPSTSRTENNAARVKTVLDRNQRLSVQLMSEEEGLPKTDVHRIVTEDPRMRKIAHTWFLHHENAPSHTSFAVREFLAQHNITTLPHLQYSPDLAPCDFFLFPTLKTHLKGHILGQLKKSRQLRREL